MRLLILLLLASSSVISQVSLQIEYNASHKILKQGFNGKNTLTVFDTLCLFRHNDYPAESQFSENGNGFATFVLGDREGMPVFTDWKNKKVEFKTDGGYTFKAMGSECFVFSEMLPNIKWRIRTDTSQYVAGYTCNFAEGDFGGRTYLVWFAPELPISIGPYKLNGLPGIILSAKSTDQMVSWHCLRVSKPDGEKNSFETAMFGKRIEKVEFCKFVLRNKHRVENNPGLGTAKLTISDPHPETAIEKSFYHCIGDTKN